MNIYLQSSGKPELLKYTQDITGDMRSNFPHEVTGFTATGRLGKLACRELAANGFRVLHLVISVKENSRLQWLQFSKHPFIIYMAAGAASLDTAAAPMLFLEVQLNLLYQPSAALSLLLKAGKLHQLLIVVTMPALVERYTHSFPSLPVLLAATQQQQPYALFAQPSNGNLAIAQLVHSLLHSSFTTPQHLLHLVIKLLDLLFHTLSLPSERKPAPRNGGLRNLVLEAAAFITANADSHYSIEQIGRKFGLSKSLLQKGFQQEYGMGLYAYLQQVRMAKAMQLVQEGKFATKAIAATCGYNNTGNFLKAFKRAHGLSPAQIRKQK